MKKFTSLCLICTVFSSLVNTVVFAQADFDPREFFVEAESYFLFEEYKDALPLYQRILAQEPDNYNVTYKIGICYLNDPYQVERSIKYLHGASFHINQKYKIENYKEKLAPLEVLYYLGQAYRMVDSLEKAIQYYTQFKNMVDPAIYDLEVVHAELESCEVAKKMKKNPVYHKVVNLGPDINTRFAEIRPILSGDGKTLIFTRELQFYDAVFITTRDSAGKWSPPYNLTPDFGLDGNSYTTAITYHGDEIFAYRSDDFDGNLYSSKKNGGRWSKLTRLNGNINTKYWESHATISNDGKYLYFTSNRKGGYGGLDIYVSERDSYGEWGAAINLGPVVNSKYNDDAVFYSPVDESLYFSSLGHYGMGGYDIFMAKKIGKNKWSKPENMGYPVNTTSDDLYYCPINFGEYNGIYSIYSPENTYGLKDIYWVEVYNDLLPREFIIRGNVNAPEPGLFVKNKILATLIENRTGKVVSQTQLDSLGYYELTATQGSYQLMIDGKGIKPKTVAVEVDIAQKGNVIEMPLISAVATKSKEDKAVEQFMALPELTVAGDNYILTDTVPVSISLNVEQGSELRIDVYSENELVKSEEFYVPKEKFTYLLTPESGENRILFTLTDKDGNVNQQEVMVYYTPEIQEPVAVLEEELSPTALPELAAIAATGLQSYLQTLGDVDYDSKVELYTMLIANADENGYSQEDVDELFSYILAQRDKDEFVKSIYSTPEFDNRRISDSLLDELDFPLGIVQETKKMYSDDDLKINTGLITVIPDSESTEDKGEYILSFVKDSTITDRTVTGKSNVEIWESLITVAGKSEASKAVNLASTVLPLDYYYQNLLVSSDNELRTILTEINFEQEGISNSVDLINYLFEQSESGRIDIGELISALEDAQIKRNNNLYNFKQALASDATGNLKITIEDIDLEKNNISEYEQLLDLILLKSRSGDYSPLEVYELLIKQIGITKVDKFAEVLSTYSGRELDSLLSNTDLKQFSKPVELIQFLLSQSPFYDYTDSDINNLLLRMLLEKGIKDYIPSTEFSKSEKTIKQRRVTSSIVLINIGLVIILILFWRKRKKKKKE